MSTKKKTESNRKNAQNSTGPKSADGKMVVSQNARTHGLLTHNLIIKGESQEKFSELMNLLVAEFQPVGLVEHALVERLGIALWRQRRLVQAESAEVSLNQQRFGYEQKREIGSALKMESEDFQNIQAPEDETEDIDITPLKDRMKLWKSLLEEEVDETENPFAHLPAQLKRTLLEDLEVDASQIDSTVKEEYHSWTVLFDSYVKYYETLIQGQRIREVSRLIMKRQALPSRTDLLSRYQTALDNDFYKALKALREAQAWRQSKALISVTPVHPDVEGNEE